MSKRKGYLLKYSSGWIRASKRLRRAVRHCERCGAVLPVRRLEVHHMGVPYADGRPGNPRDKHDWRRENLLVLCSPCHDEVDQRVERRQQGKARREAHDALGVGTGLVLYREVRA